jgi:peptidoglycan hydrolase-like protein with peptidoglycan-binding domain
MKPSMSSEFTFPIVGYQPPRRRWSTTLFVRVAALIVALGAAAALTFTAVLPSAEAAPAPIKLTSSSCPSLIKQGQHSGCVTELQQLLNAKIGAGLVKDGEFGPKTKAAVIGYQRAKNLSVDGIVGPQTKSSLYAGTNQPPPPYGSARAKAVSYARAIANGGSLGSWSGGHLPYSWGGGHGSKAGPSFGTCAGYTSSIHPCPATHTRGLDCSGFSRWIYALAYGRDVLGAGNTDMQLAHLHRVSNPEPGDLAYFGHSSNTHHVGIYIGGGKMIDAPHTAVSVRVDSLHSDLVGYYRYG